MKSVTPNGNLEESFLSVVYNSFTNLGNSCPERNSFRNICTNKGRPHVERRFSTKRVRINPLPRGEDGPEGVGRGMRAVI